MLFGAGTSETLAKMDEATFLSVFEGVPQYHVAADLLQEGVPVLDLLCTHTPVFSSKGEGRRAIDGGGLYINKNKVLDINAVITCNDVIQNKYLLVQKGKKNYVVININ